MANIRYGAGGVPYHVQEDDIKITKVEVKPEKKRNQKRKKRK